MTYLANLQEQARPLQSSEGKLERCCAQTLLRPQLLCTVKRQFASICFFSAFVLYSGSNPAIDQRKRLSRLDCMLAGLLKPPWLTSLLHQMGHVRETSFENLSVVEKDGHEMAGSYGCKMPLHTFANCDISGQRPMNLYKEFPRVHKL